CDETVIAGSRSKNLSSEFEPGCKRGVAILFKLGRDAVVICGIGDDGNAFEIFSGRTQHRGSADVDVLNQLLGSESRFCGSLLKWIEIDDDEVDWRDAVFRRLFLILCEIAAVEQSAMNFWMECFHAAAQHFRPTGEFRDIFDSHAGIAKELCR